MWAAASKKGGVGGVPQAVGKEFAAADKGGTLPEHETEKAKRRKAMYDHPRSKREGRDS